MLGLRCKRLELLKEIAPETRVVFHVAPASAWESAVGTAIRGAAQQADLTLVGPAVDSPYNEPALTRAFERAVSMGANAAIANSAPENVEKRELLVRLSEQWRLPTMYPFRSYVEAGGLAAYDVNIPELFRHAGTQVAAILDGTPVSEIPFYQSTTFSLILNLKTATALNLTIPPTLLARADEVIE